MDGWESFYRGQRPQIESLDFKRLQLINGLLLLARKCTLLNWISEKPPTVTQRYKDIQRVFAVERQSGRFKGNDKSFSDIRQPLWDLTGIIQRECFFHVTKTSLCRVMLRPVTSVPLVNALWPEHCVVQGRHIPACVRGATPPRSVSPCRVWGRGVAGTQSLTARAHTHHRTVRKFCCTDASRKYFHHVSNAARPAWWNPSLCLVLVLRILD